MSMRVLTPTPLHLRMERGERSFAERHLRRALPDGSGLGFGGADANIRHQATAPRSPPSANAAPLPDDGCWRPRRRIQGPIRQGGLDADVVLRKIALPSPSANGE